MRSAMAPQRHDVTCLGTVHVQTDGREIDLAPRAIALVAYLAGRGSPALRAEVAATFWPDHDGATARTNLRSTLSRLNRDLPGLVDIGRHHVALADDGRPVVDVARFEAACERGLGRDVHRDPDARADLMEAVRAYGGELLPGRGPEISDVFDEWVSAERTRLHLRATQALKSLIDLDIEAGPSAATLGYAERLVRLDDMGEASHARLLRTLWALGERIQAVRRHQRWAEKLRVEFGLEPSEELHRLVSRLRTGGGTPHQPWRQRPLALPDEVLGRDHDVLEVSQLLAGGARLVTLTGAPGVGKSVVALSVATHERLRAQRPTVLVDVTGVASVSGLVRAVLAEGGGATAAPAPGEALLHDRVGGRALLLVLDGLEAGTPGLDDMLERLLAECPRLVLLVTGRGPLRLVREHVHPVAPWPVPQARASSPELRSSAAVSFLLEKARRAGVPVQGSAGELRDVASICRALDGMPWLLELAAARLPLLGLAGLAQALEDVDVLTLLDGIPDSRRGGLRAATERQLRWLSADARLLLPRLSVFPASFAQPDVTCLTEGVDALRALADLIDAGLLVPEAPGVERKLRLGPAAAALAGELLAEQGQIERWRQRRTEQVVTEVLNWGAGSGDDINAFARFGTDAADLVAALDDLLRRGDRGRALAALRALGPLWRLSGWHEDGAALLGRVVAAASPGPTVPDPLAGREECGVWLAGIRAEARGRDALGEVRALLSAAVPRVLDSASDWRARCLVEAIAAWALVGEWPRALELARRVAAADPGPQRSRWTETARWQSVVLAHLCGEERDAEATLAALVTEARERGDRRLEAGTCFARALVGAESSDFSAAGPDLPELLEMAEELDDAHIGSWVHTALAGRAEHADRRLAAAEHLAAGLRVAGRYAHRRGQELALCAVVAWCWRAGMRTSAAQLCGAVSHAAPSLVPILPQPYHEDLPHVLEEIRRAAGEEREVASAVRAGTRLALDAAADQAAVLLDEVCQRG